MKVLNCVVSPSWRASEIVEGNCKVAGAVHGSAALASHLTNASRSGLWPIKSRQLFPVNQTRHTVQRA